MVFVIVLMVCFEVFDWVWMLDFGVDDYMVKFIDFFEFEVCCCVVLRWKNGEVINLIFIGGVIFDLLLGIFYVGDFEV